MKTDFVIPPKLAFDGVPNLSDYFGLWAMHVPIIMALAERANGLNLYEHVASDKARERVEAQNQRPYAVTPDGIAMFRISGPMMKSVSSMADGTSTIRMRQQVRAARRDPEVKGGFLVLDTPGGTVSGNRDLADDIAAFAAAKPLYAFTEDLTASAGVSLASQATKRYANNATALYGSMGTYSVLVDQSGLAEKLGVKVYVIQAGEFKGMGQPGTEITTAQLEEAQRIVNALNAGYLETIARGLNKPVAEIQKLADGRIHTAADAQGMGLIDGIQSFDETYAQLVAAVKPQTKNTSFHRSKTTMEKATLAELKSAFPNATSDWLLSQLEAGATMLEAATAYGKFVETKAAAERDEHAKQVKELQDKADAATKTKGGSLGHNPILPKAGAHGSSTGTEEDDLLQTGDPKEDFELAVSKIAGPRATLDRRQAAIRQVARANPELYQGYLLATNTTKRQARLISEKLEAFAPN